MVRMTVESVKAEIKKVAGLVPGLVESGQYTVVKALLGMQFKGVVWLEKQEEQRRK